VGGRGVEPQDGLGICENGIRASGRAFDQVKWPLRRRDRSTPALWGGTREVLRKNCRGYVEPLRPLLLMRGCASERSDKQPLGVYASAGHIGVGQAHMTVARQPRRDGRDSAGPPLETLLKPGAVAFRLGVSRSWLYEAAKDGRMPSIRLGGPHGPLRFVESDLVAWIERARDAWQPGDTARDTLERAARRRARVPATQLPLPIHAIEETDG